MKLGLSFRWVALFGVAPQFGPSKPLRGDFMSEVYTHQEVTGGDVPSTQALQFHHAVDFIGVGVPSPDPLKSSQAYSYSAVNSSSGFYNPRWRDQVRYGQSATTAFSGTKYTARLGFHAYGTEEHWTYPGQSLQCFYKEDTGLIFNGVPWALVVPVVPDDVRSRVTNRVISKFLSKCQESRTAFEAGQDFGDYEETLRSIHRPLNSLSQALNSYLSALTKRRRGIRRKVLLRKVLADTYLEFRLGWLPLVDDVASALVKCGETRAPFANVVATAGEDFNASESDVSFSLPSGFENQLRPHAKISDRSTFLLRYKGAIRTGTDSNGKVSAAQELQLLPRNWLPTAWDLLPYSWIADYFTNIGDMIQSLTFVYGDLIWAQKTELVQRKNDVHDLWISNPNIVTDLAPPWTQIKHTPYVIPDRTTYLLRHVERSVLLPDDLFARFQFRIPHSKYPFYNIAALLFSRATKLIPFF